jgi:hypothetical protein
MYMAIPNTTTTSGKYTNGIDIEAKNAAVDATVASIILVRFENESR